MAKILVKLTDTKQNTLSYIIHLHCIVHTLLGKGIGMNKTALSR